MECIHGTLRSSNLAVLVQTLLSFVVRQHSKVLGEIRFFKGHLDDDVVSIYISNFLRAVNCISV